MKIEKDVFHKTILQYKENPSTKNRDLYTNQISKMVGAIVYKYKLPEHEDLAQDLILYSLKKNIHNWVKPEQNSFSYYWKSLMQQAFLITKKGNEKKMILGLNTDLEVDDDSEEAETEMLKRLDFNLDDYQAQQIIENEFNDVETIELKRGKRGRPKTKADGEKAQHWEYIFKLLRRKKTMTEKALFNQLPGDKQESLKDATKSIEFYMRQIANREGVNLSISDSGTDKIYMVIE